MATRMRVARRAVRRGRSLVARPSAAAVERAAASDEVFDVASCFVHSTYEPAPAAEPEPVARPSYSRPPAPLLALTPPLPSPRAEAAEEEEQDPNATTLPSVDFETPSRPRASSVAVVEAEDEPPSTRKVGWLQQPVPGFVPEAEEPALDEAFEDAEAELEPTPTLEGAFFREQHASLLPVVDDIEPLPEPELLTPEQSRRRARLRRGVGIGVTVAALLTLALAAKVAITPAAPHAERHHAAALVNTEIPQLERPAVAPPAVPSPAPVAVEEAKSEEASTVGDDPVALGKEAVRLLNERKPEQAAAVARQLVALKPDNAYGYRCLGAALQDLGDYPAAREVYSECVTHAVEGDVHECGALGGTKLER